MKKLYLWGGGKYLEAVYGAVNKEKCTILGVIDKDGSKHGRIVAGGIPVGPPDILFNVKYDYLLITAKNYKPILEDCKNFGIDGKKILIFWAGGQGLSGVVDENAKRVIELEEQLQVYQWKLNNMPYELGVEPGPEVKSSEELLNYIIEKKASLCRFGDGEFEIMRGKERPWYQNADRGLSNRLQDIIRSDHANIAIAIANNFGSLDCYTEEAANAIRQYLYGGTRGQVMKFFDRGRFYYDAYVSRPYIIYRDKSHAKVIFDLFQKVWHNRKLLIVEGENTKTGVGNGLFQNAKRVRRVICPGANAFSQYQRILNTVQNLAEKEELVIASLGPTATVLAYDLGMGGLQTLDVGQIDNEYEWYIRNVQERVEIPGKGVAELSWCHEPNGFIADDSYEGQVIGRIGAE